MDWSLIEARLFLGDGDDLRAKRNELFKRLNANGSGTLSLSDAQVGVPHLFEAKPYESAKVWKHPSGKVAYLVPVKDFRPAVRCAFKSGLELSETASGKKRKQKGVAETTVDRREFHAFLMAFRMYLELDVLFSSVDESGDRELDYHEVKKMLPLMEKWGITQDRVDQLPEFMNKDSGRMRFEAFARLCINRRTFLDGKAKDITLDEVDCDSNRVGCADTSAATLEALQMARAEQSKAAKVAPAQVPIKSDKTLGALQTLSSNVLGQDTMSIPRAEAMEAFNKRLLSVQDTFKDFDKDGSGSISKDELTWLLQKLAPGISRKEVSELFTAADTDKDGSVDWNEFVAFVFRGVVQRST